MKTLLTLALGAFLAAAVACDRPSSTSPSEASVKQKDPVCSMQVNKADAKDTTYEGKTYYFCSTECRDKFKASPSTYLLK